MTQAEFRQLMMLSYVAPRAAARYWIDQRLPLVLICQALLLMAVVLTLIGGLEHAMAQDQPPPQLAGGNQFSVVLVHAVLLLVPAALIHVIGERSRSTARFADAILMIVWLQFVLLPIQIAATLTLGAGSGLTDAILFVYVAVTFWLLTHFVTELHGYKSRMNVFLGILTVSIVLGLMLIPFIDPSFAGA